VRLAATPSLSAAVLAAVVVAAVGSAARAQPLVADLSRHLIAITAAFDGTEVLLFGTVERGADVVVVVRGPPETAVVRRKSRTLGIWLNTESARFVDVPSFYAVAASAAVDDLLPAAVRARHRIGVANLVLEPSEALPAAEVAAFRDGLVRNKRRIGLYPREPAPVRFVSGGLFRTTIAFPANVRPGRYVVEVFDVRDGAIAAAQQSALIITKVGVEARLSDFARREAALYGLGAIVFAVVAGWVAATALRRT
jgi:uncharacterized protein (TIGR02186 family)